MTLLQSSNDARVRSNIIVAIGDMSFRFPNLVAPWARHMYARLRDNDTAVRKNTLMVLSHLILNDMLKAKGPISEIAKCLHDDDTRISDLVIAHVRIRHAHVYAIHLCM